jgi:hypothetical protein
MLRASLTHCPTVSACIFACQSSDTCDIWDILDINDSGSLSKLKLNEYELPVQEIKIATEIDFSWKGLDHLDAIVLSALIKVCKL